MALLESGLREDVKVYPFDALQNREKDFGMIGPDLRNDNVVLLTPLPLVAGVVFRHRTTPKNAEGICCTRWVLTGWSWYSARTSLKVGIEALTTQSARTSISAFLDVVARHNCVSGCLVE